MAEIGRFLQPSLSHESPKEFLFKILVVGDVGTGKTSIVRRYVMNFFNQYYKATVRTNVFGKIYPILLFEFP
jgi:GTPase SAR1 family protein